MGRTLTELERNNRFESKWPEWKLIEFNGVKGPCKVQHKCGNIKCYETYFNVEKRGPTCQKCIDNKKWYWDIGDTIDNLIIIGRRALPNTLQEYQYKCNICGFDGSKPVYFKGEYMDEYWVQGRGIKNGNRCACCRGFVVQPGINDVATTAKDIIDYFYDKTEVNKWTKSSEHKIKIMCPICNTIQPNKIRIGNLVHEGFNCINCGNNISYPEKLMYFLLKELDVDFKIHKVFDWSQSVYDDYDKQYHKREYDFYIPSINTIIEMHGSQHYRLSFLWGDAQDSLEHRKNIDKDKQRLAEQNGYNYIVINCSDSNKNYIKNNIMGCKLSSLFNLNNINWDKISRKALNGVAKLVVEDKEKHPEKLTTELAEQYGIHYSTIFRWLKKAGIYNASQEKQRAGLKQSCPVYSPELRKAFRSAKLASEEVGVGIRAIHSASNPNIYNQKHAGHHPITGELLTWERWTLEQYEEWCKNQLLTIQN